MTELIKKHIAKYKEMQKGKCGESWGIYQFKIVALEDLLIDMNTTKQEKYCCFCDCTLDERRGDHLNSCAKCE